MNADEQRMWDRWVETREASARNGLVMLHAEWARKVARDVFVRVRLPRADWADVMQNATMGLIQAVERFDPGVGVTFHTYARHRVRGAVFNGLRHMLSLTRGDSSSMVEIERVQSLVQDEGDDLVDAFIRLTVGLGLGHMLSVQSIPTPERTSDGPYANTEHAQVRERAKDAIGQLPERERRIITLHYYQHMPFVKIAELMGVSKGRIAQLHRQALMRMRCVLHDQQDALSC